MYVCMYMRLEHLNRKQIFLEIITRFQSSFVMVLLCAAAILLLAIFITKHLKLNKIIKCAL